MAGSTPTQKTGLPTAMVVAIALAMEALTSRTTDAHFPPPNPLSAATTYVVPTLMSRLISSNHHGIPCLAAHCFQTPKLNAPLHIL